MSTDLLTPCRNGAARSGLERTRFYPRQLVTPDDLTQDQIYFREKHRRHNRLLHGWGVVCGACVRPGRTACEVAVEPGYILGPWGDEIVIPEEVTVDLCKLGSREQLGCCDPAPLDPWCGEARADCPQGTVYLAIRYEECDARPVRTPRSACGCGCDDSACEYSRIRDGYALALLRELPPTYSTPMPQPTLAEVLPCSGARRTAKPCPPCPESPWVILADLAVDRECRVRGVDCFTHRRYVVSWASFYLTCMPVAGLFTPRPQTVETNIARTMAAVTGSAALMDMAAPAGTPNASVAMMRPDGQPVLVPAFFAVRPGETVADLLEREGDRRYYDPATDRTFSLRELYALAGVPAGTRLEGTAAALAPLEGRTLDVGGARDRRAALDELLDSSGLKRLDRELGGSAARAPELPAVSLVGVAPRSSLGQFLADMSIADVAVLSQDRFVAAALEAVPEQERKRVQKQAADLWTAARRVRELGRESG